MNHFAPNSVYYEVIYMQGNASRCTAQAIKQVFEAKNRVLLKLTHRETKGENVKKN